jgi:hypothetical protein
MATIPGFNRIRLRKVGSTVENPLTFGSGLTRTADTVTNNLTTGIGGGQTINGGIVAGENLTIQSSSAAGPLIGQIIVVTGQVEVRQGTTQSILRVYNTYSAAGANFERAELSWNSNQLSIGASAAGTGTLRDVFFVGNSFTFANTLQPAVSKGTPIGTSGIPFGTIFANRFEAPATTVGFVLSGDATNISFTGTGTQTIAKSGGSLFIQTTTANDVVLNAGTGPTECFRIQGSNSRMLLATASRAANGSVATVLGSLGPAGSHTTVQEWLTVDSSAGGVQRWIPMF